MHQFYFNECLPNNTELASFTTLLADSIGEYHQLIQANLSVQKGIVTEKIPSSITFNDSFSLSTAIEHIEDRACRSLAYSYFTKYPVQSFIESTSEEELLAKEYHLIIDDTQYDALNLALISSVGGLTFTVASHDELKKDRLPLVSKNTQSTLEVCNLFGKISNTQFIRQELVKRNSSSLSLFEQLKELLNDPVYNTGFEKDFLKLSQTNQVAIISRFRQALERSLSSPLYPDTKIVKDVSPSNSKCQVYELRVYNPDLRVYFHESPDRVYLSSIELKSNPDQNKDIVRASQNLYKLIYTF
jgi:hypothetical protein